jgi:hypothetical protein
MTQWVLDYRPPSWMFIRYAGLNDYGVAAAQVPPVLSTAASSPAPRENRRARPATGRVGGGIVRISEARQIRIIYICRIFRDGGGPWLIG